jgi:hypothetical protein
MNKNEFISAPENFEQQIYLCNLIIVVIFCSTYLFSFLFYNYITIVIYYWNDSDPWPVL